MVERGSVGVLEWWSDGEAEWWITNGVGVERWSVGFVDSTRSERKAKGEGGMLLSGLHLYCRQLQNTAIFQSR